jgi:hypothetical protein
MSYLILLLIPLALCGWRRSVLGCEGHWING